MLDGKKTKGLGVLIGLGSPSADKGSDDDESSKALAAKALIKAVKASDADGVVEAFELLRDACNAKDSDSDSDDTSK